MAKRKKKTAMTWELRQYLPTDIHDGWDSLSEAERERLVSAVLHRGGLGLGASGAILLGFALAGAFKF